eukprot:3730508-Heterocapsa_arctica.AAC.1
MARCAGIVHIMLSNGYYGRTVRVERTTCILYAHDNTPPRPNTCCLLALTLDNEKATRSSASRRGMSLLPALSQHST